MSPQPADFQDGGGAGHRSLEPLDGWEPPAWTQVDAVDDALPGFPTAEPFPHPAVDPVLPTRWDALDGGTDGNGVTDVGFGDAEVGSGDADRSDTSTVDTWGGDTWGDDSWSSESTDAPAANVLSDLPGAVDTTFRSDVGTNHDGWSSDGFTAAAPEPWAVADVPVAAVVTLDSPLAAAAGPTLYDDAYRVAFRLTGRREESHGIASSALRDIVPDGTARVLAVMVNAVAGARAADLGDESRIPYRQHRARLRRELGRHSERDQAILALRHLVGVPAMAVAARLGLHESVVREVASAWRPADSRGDSSALLRGIDSWISNGLAAADDEGGSELAHLDDPGD